jgi:hypothetical protein
MKLSATSRKGLILLWVFAIGWFYLGSLINFHQHHIWGKSLIPQINACSRSKGKTLIGDNNEDSSGVQLTLTNDNYIAESIEGFAIPEPVYITVAGIQNLIDPFFPPHKGCASFQLRGPPQA